MKISEIDMKDEREMMIKLAQDSEKSSDARIKAKQMSPEQKEAKLYD